ncbi:hypothetical protein JCGZ_08850 [Jatropha curcas]|uniref:Uncharacterized protein n=1 Tax=Jatropha curcas TaxID=180498 RepID=A0A067KKC3_JATCU|nr:hypothetical protein JCGZ_08850 [Jatropha curcas]
MASFAGGGRGSGRGASRGTGRGVGVNTQILRLKEPVFSDCKQSGRTEGHSGSSSEICQYGT